MVVLDPLHIPPKPHIADEDYSGHTEWRYVHYLSADFTLPIWVLPYLHAQCLSISWARECMLIIKLSMFWILLSPQKKYTRQNYKEIVCKLDKAMLSKWRLPNLKYIYGNDSHRFQWNTSLEVNVLEMSVFYSATQLSKMSWHNIGNQLSLSVFIIQEYSFFFHFTLSLLGHSVTFECLFNKRFKELSLITTLLIIVIFFVLNLLCIREKIVLIF